MLPKEIVDAAENQKLAIFAGAGVSTEARGVFNLTLYDDVRRELKIGSKKRISFSDLMTLYCTRKTRRVLLHKIKSRFDYMKLFPEIYRDATRFHTELSTIPYIQEIVTTNWDDHFERECDAAPIVTPDDFAAFSDIPGRKVFKIHGSVTNYGSIVATAEDYRACYRHLRTGVIGSVLKVLLSSKTIAFVGYSFQDEDFGRVYRLLNREVRQLLPSAYVVTLDENAKATLASMRMNITPIVTDATFFLATLKAQLVKKKLMLPDERYSGLRTAYDTVFEAQNNIFPIDPRSHPENIYSLVYQDGLMHGLEDVIGSRKSGRFSDEHTLMHMKEGLFDWYFGLGTGGMVFVLFIGLFLVFALASALQGNFADARLGATGFVLFLIIFLVGRRRGTRSEQEEPERSVALSVRVVEGKLVHAKLYIVDEQVALVGSANLTYSGMNRNIERLEVKTSTSEIEQEMDAFLDLWGQRTK